MFGIGTFGELTFAESVSPSGIYNLSIAETGSAVDAVSTFAVFASSILETVAAADAPSSLAVVPSDIAETISAFDAISSVAIYPNTVSDALASVDEQSWATTVLGEFNLFGEATLEFVGTTKFIDMIEQGEVEIGIAAEIRTRSL